MRNRSSSIARSADSIAVTGDLKSDGATELRLTGASTVGGSIQVQRGVLADVTGARVTGNIQIDAMQGPAVFSGNRATGNLQAIGSCGGVTLNSSTMGGVMQCKENLPPPTGSGNVATLKQDQCLTL